VPDALGDAAGGGDGLWLEALDAPLHSSDAARVAGEVVNHHRLPRKRDTWPWDPMRSEGCTHGDLYGC